MPRYINRDVLLGALMIILSSLLGLYLPLVLRQVIDGQEGLNIGQLARIVSIFFSQAILISAGHYLMARSGENLVADKRKRVSRHLIYSPVAFFNYQKSGDLSSRIVNDTTSIGKFYTSHLPSLIASLVTIVGTVAILFILDWRLSLTFLVSLPLLGVIVVPISSANHKVSQILQEDISRLTGNLTENFNKIELIKANGAEKHRLTILEDSISKIRKSALKADLMAAIASPFVLLVMFGSIALIFTYGGQRVALGSLTIGTLISFLVYLFQIINPVGVVGSIANEFAKMKGATKQVDELFKHRQEKFAIGDNNLMIGQVTFEQVSFAYQAEQAVLSNINFILPKGQKIAFVGPSGSGKTTLINLLERFYPVTAGRICLDGRNIEEFDLSAWRSQLALVSQTNGVLSGTIRENLLFGLTEQPSEEVIEQALREAYLWEDIQKFEQGLETYVGEGGKLLSGGQRQRLQIARAYLKNAPIIIFDEATANLDADAEFAVGQTIKTLLADKTVLMIAHRLSTVVDADKIYFLENGQITGSGRHQELLDCHKTYARFVAEQMI